MNNLYDVAVIGARPAGSLASYYLSQSGISTLLIEKEQLPRYKTCGGGLVYRARKILPELEENVIERECFELDWSIMNDHINFKVKRPFPIITMIMRDKFDNHLVDLSIKKGTKVLDNTRLQSMSTNGTVSLKTNNGEFRARMVIGSDGALGPTARMAGFSDPRYLIPALEAEVVVDEHDFSNFSNRVRFDVDAIPMGYGWLFPKKNHLSIGIASEMRGKMNLKDAYRNYINSLGITKIISERVYGFQIPIKSRKKYTSKNILLTGDAAGLADPLVAEGISHALISGKLAAEFIIEGNMEWSRTERIYNDKLTKNIILQTRTGQLLSKLFYHYPRLRRNVLNRKGQRLTEYFTDVFCGNRRYPEGFGHIASAVMKAIF